MLDKINLSKKILVHLEECGIKSEENLVLKEKNDYRNAHFFQRQEKIVKNEKFLITAIKKYSQYFANGEDIDPCRIKVRIEEVMAGSIESELFRLCTLYWSVPVSEGYGRRMRFIVWDEYNGKIIGIFALGDAVFNLKARDDYIGWSSEDRKNKLVNIMDAYILGAIPPYNVLLGGKLIASIIKSTDVAHAFRKKYKNSVGLISGDKKNPYLTAVTVTSALGRSSVYNRLKLNNELIFKKIGMTSGWGHFHFSDEIFSEMVILLKNEGDNLFNTYEFGSGPNWRIRVIKKALNHLGLSERIMKHGYLREIYISEFSLDFKKILLSKKNKPNYSTLNSVDIISQEAIDRWILPRSTRNSSYLNIYKNDFFLSLKN